ncbi:Expp1 protein [Parasponia andersonii]|uniref:Expp1 protein n=1 Tax=Parasponia andersonii TaxID=3476 RepID=A0A2P5B003_PARAD|nr:Expp1 protein [Parasponia andersonii]
MAFDSIPKRISVTMMMMMMMMTLGLTTAGDTNPVFTPCSDTRVSISDGFTFGIVFARSNSFFNGNKSQLSPCDRRLSLSSSNAQVAIFRPKVDEISLLTINSLSFSPDNVGGYMVAFAGQKYAARSPLAFVANSTYTVTSFTLVLEFKKGRLQNLYWKRDGCAQCSGNSNFVCLNKQDCAIKTSSCKTHGGSVDCSIGIQLAFSGTDEHLSALNSWYEVENLRQYSLYSLYSNLKDSLTGQYNKIF